MSARRAGAYTRRSMATRACRSVATRARRCARVDPARGVIRLRANAADSSYHSLQVSLDKRLSRGLSAGAHYTWSKFVDGASDTFNVSRAERSRSRRIRSISATIGASPRSTAGTGSRRTSCGSCRSRAIRLASMGRAGGRVASQRCPDVTVPERVAVHRAQRRRIPRARLPASTGSSATRSVRTSTRTSTSPA